MQNKRMIKGDRNSEMVRLEQAQATTRALFSLREPWRERFLSLVASMALGRSAALTNPTPEQVQQWLFQDSELCREVACLVRSWSGHSVLNGI